MTSPSPPASRARGRWTLVALFVLFFGSVAGAGILRFSGWQPAGHKNHGQMLEPPGDLRALAPVLADGGRYAWRQPQRTWRMALAPAAGYCEGEHAPACVALGRDLDKVWQLFGHRADQVHILWIGTPPAGAPRPPSLRVLRPEAALLAQLPRVDDPAGVPVYVIDPNGFVVMRFAPGFDPADLRSDMAKLLKTL